MFNFNGDFNFHGAQTLIWLEILSMGQTYVGTLI